MQLLPGNFGIITSWTFPLRTLPLKTLHCQIKSLSFGLHINESTVPREAQHFHSSYQEAKSMNEEAMLEVASPGPGPQPFGSPTISLKRLGVFQGSTT